MIDSGRLCSQVAVVHITGQRRTSGNGYLHLLPIYMFLCTTDSLPLHMRLDGAVHFSGRLRTRNSCEKTR